MPQYTIYGIVSASKVLGVIEAPSKEDAIEIAWADDAINEEMYISLCHQCEDGIDVGDIYDLEASEVE